MDLPDMSLVTENIRTALQRGDANRPTASEDLGQEFEAVFVTQFVDEMMKTVPQAAFGSEKQAEMWRSFMSEALAQALVEQGGVGLATPVQDMINAYDKAQRNLGQ